MPRLLTAEEVSRQMTDLPQWSVDDALVGRFECADFPSAIRLVNQVADEANAADHHPDIDIRYNTVVLALSTHSEGGVTQLDVELAHRADQAYQRLMAETADDAT